MIGHRLDVDLIYRASNASDRLGLDFDWLRLIIIVLRIYFKNL